MLNELETEPFDLRRRTLQSLFLKRHEDIFQRNLLHRIKIRICILNKLLTKQRKQFKTIPNKNDVVNWLLKNWIMLNTFQLPLISRTSNRNVKYYTSQSMFAVRMKKHWAFSYPLSACSEDWSDWADAQTDPSLRWTHGSFCWFCRAAAHMECCHISKTACNRFGKTENR